MAPRIKKIRSFSPYQYNIQYAKPGRGPVQIAKPYVKTASVTENEYVVTKLDPKFFTFLENAFYYTIDDECNVSFNKLVSTFNIRSDKRMIPYEINELIESKLHTKVISANTKNGIQYYWKSRKIMQINHNLNSMVECVAILNNSEYLRCTKTYISSNIIDLNFSNEFNGNDVITIILIQLSNNYNITNNMISFKEFNYDEILEDDLKGNIVLDNKFGNSNLFPIIFNTDGKSYELSYFDIAPNHIAFKESDLKSINDFDSEIDVYTLNLNEIRKQNLNIPDNVLYKENETFRKYFDLIQENEKKIKLLNDYGRKYDIEKIVLYYFNTKYNKHDVQYNVNTNFVTWTGKNTVEIKHNLNGYVTYLLDDINMNMVKIYKVDANCIKLEFLQNIPNVFSIKIYKVN